MKHVIAICWIGQAAESYGREKWNLAKESEEDYLLLMPRAPDDSKLFQNEISTRQFRDYFSDISRALL